MIKDFSIEEILVDEVGNHINDIIDVRTEAYREWNGEKTFQQKRDEAISWIEKMRDRSNTRIYVAKIDDSIVGYVWGYEKAENEFYISHIGVLPEFQRRGIGRSLVQKCETLCVDRGYERLSTSTYNKFRGMLILLLKAGFEIASAQDQSEVADNRIYLPKEIGG